MLKAALGGIAALGLSAAAVMALEVDCDKAYKSALDKIKRERGVSTEQAAVMRRAALRIYHACETGHLQDPKALFEKLDRAKD